MNGNFQLFKPSGGAAGTAASDYLKDAFEDLSVPATNNSGLNSTISTNPLNGYFANDDGPKYGPKTLYIKDLVLIEDRSKWQQGQPTYQVIFNESFPGVLGYVWGTPELRRGVIYNGIADIQQPFQSMDAAHMVNVKFVNGVGGVGITCKGRRVQWLVTPTSNLGSGAGYVAQLQVDGANTTTIPIANNRNTYNRNLGRSYTAEVNSASNATNDLHDFRLLASDCSVAGVVVYFENTGANIEFDPGVSYVDKMKIETTAGASLALPAFGSSLGGSSVLYKDSFGNYGATSLSIIPVSMASVGASGTDQITVATGSGASLKINQGVIATFGTSTYVGVIKNISTDTLTVSPTLAIGVSGVLYPYFYSSPTLAISATLFGAPAFSLGKEIFKGSSAFLGLTGGDQSQYYQDPDGNFSSIYTALYERSQSVTYASNQFALFPVVGSASLIPCVMQVQGRFSAAEVEFLVDQSTAGDLIDYFVSINGLTTFAVSASVDNGTTATPQIIRQTLVSDAGTDWKVLRIGLGASHSTNVGISKVNLYKYRPEAGVSAGALAHLDTLQAEASIDANGVRNILVAPGTYQRYYTPQLFFQGAWSQQVGSGTDSNANIDDFFTTSSSATIQFQWYGKNLTIWGAPGGASVFMSIDGVQDPAGLGASFFNRTIPVASEGFHSLVLGRRVGTLTVGAIDIGRTHAELESLQNFVPLTEEKIRITDWIPYVCDMVSGVDGTILNIPPEVGQVRAKYKIIDDQMFVEIAVSINAPASDTGYVFGLPRTEAVDFKNYYYGDGGDPDVTSIFTASGTANCIRNFSGNYVCGVALKGNRYIYPAMLVTSDSFLSAQNNFSVNFALSTGDFILMRAQFTIVKPGT